MKNISAPLKFYKMGYEAPEWPLSGLGSFGFGAPDPMYAFWESPSPSNLYKPFYAFDRFKLRDVNFSL
jgi:hypothetical protein